MQKLKNVIERQNIKKQAVLFYCYHYLPRVFVFIIHYYTQTKIIFTKKPFIIS